MTAEPINVLFLCTGNSARSILSEVVLNSRGAGRFRGWSAGSTPKDAVNPWSVRVLQAHGYPVDGLRSKSWDEFAADGAPRMDVVVTVCDSAAGEVCPVWPGHPFRVHWGQPDPAAATGSDDLVRAAFEDALARVERRIDALLALPFGGADREDLRRRLAALAEL